MLLNLNGPTLDLIKLWCMVYRFNGADFLRRLRGKSILFVGDSLSLNQWQSLTCMLHTAVPRANYTSVRTGDLSTFTFPVRPLSLINFFFLSSSSSSQQFINLVMIETDVVMLISSMKCHIYHERERPK